MTCDRLVRIVASSGEGAGEGGRGAMEHIFVCDSCRSAWLSGELLARTPGTAPEKAAARCPSDEVLAGLVDGSAPTAAREGLITHVEVCGSCLKQVVSIALDLHDLDGVDRAIPPNPLAERAVRLARHSSRSRIHLPALLGPLQGRLRPGRTLPLFAGAAAMAVLVGGIGLLVVGRGPRTGFDEPRVLRGFTAEGPVPDSPRGEVPVAGGLRFAWSDGASGRSPGSASTSPHASYRLIVLDLETGRTVIEALTDRTFYAPGPAEAARLRSGARYQWLVVRVGGGEEISSEAAAFWLSP